MKDYNRNELAKFISYREKIEKITWKGKMKKINKIRDRLEAEEGIII